MQFALGRDETTEIRHNMHRLTKVLIGKKALFFTSSPPKKIIKFFGNFKRLEFPHSGFVAKKDFIIPPGPLNKNKFPSTLEPQLRSLGLPIKLIRGIIHVENKFPVCRKGQVLNSKKSRILKFFGKRQEITTIEIKAYWRENKVKIKKRHL